MIGYSPVTAVLRYLWPQATRPSARDRATIDHIRQVSELLKKHQADGMLARRMMELRERLCEHLAQRKRTNLRVGQSVRNLAAHCTAHGTASSGSPSDDILITCFALATEAMRRVLGITPYDVQLLGGMALSRGAIAEMQTGEGKTFTAVFPACLQALSGNGVHVMTVNAYLAQRDYELLAPVYRLLGLTVGLIESESNLLEKAAAYASDVTYGPGYEFGFDYLRDQVAQFSQGQKPLGASFRTRLNGQAVELPQLMQRGHAAAIIDEADSVMLDEATTPLILSAAPSGPAANADVYVAARTIATELAMDEHFVVDQATQSLNLTEQGIRHLANCHDRIPHRGLDRPWPAYVEQALRAEHIYRRDVHYVVHDGAIELVDQNTGRIFADRSWRDGLQQAVQARAGVTVTSETKSIANITRQRYFGRYDHLCGMTGTAKDAERELRGIYGMKVVIIPPHRPCQRVEFPTRIFNDTPAKETAIVDEISRLYSTQQPVLVGTAAIEISERIAQLLEFRHIPHQIINGKQDAEEATLVARAGKRGCVTIATNMAGRGTDIKLGQGVVEVGGLHVIVTEPQLSARIDRQLIGRAARQGDPGSCQKFAAADDSLFTRHAPALGKRIKRLAVRSGEVSVDLTREIAAVQRRVERQQADHRRSMFRQDDWLAGVMTDLLAPADEP